MTAKTRSLLLRIGAVVVLVVGLLLLRHYTTLGSYFSSQKVRALATQSGHWGIAIYVGLFALGLLIHVPGLIFVAAGVLAWGRIYGGLAAYAGALVGVTLTFAIVRAVGGQPFAQIEDARIKKILARVTSHPVSSVALVRTFAMAAAATTYALALTPVGWLPHLLGSALGLIPSVVVMSALFGILFH